MHRTARAPRHRRSAGAALALVAAVVAGTTGAGPAAAAPAPASTLPGVAGLRDAGGPGGLPATASSTPLPTVQVDGVVWAQVVVGTTVYVTGEFTSARPAGAPRGTGEVKRSNALAYDVRTGKLLPWAPALNAQGLAAAASPDGRRVYLGGDFTAVGGQTRYRIVALDAATGALDATFVPGVNARVRSLVAVGSTVYAGGVFSQAGGFQRPNLAAFAAADGAVTTWAPAASVLPSDLTRPDPARPATPEVLTMTAPAGTGTLVVGGRFTRLSDAPAFGIGALDLVTGAPQPFAAGSVVRDAGQAAAITDLASEGGAVYGSGYVFGADGNLEGSFAADAATGTVSWVDGCLGDTYSVAPAGPVLYRVGHSHDCSIVGGHPEKSPRDYQRAVATTSARSPLGRTDHAGPFAGRPSSETLHWLPQVAAGTYTGQNQGGWTIRTAGDYVVMGGEFPSVNGVAQQGLVRFAAGAAAPAATDADKPIGYSTLTPAAATVQAGRVRLGWQAAWDRDSAALRYELLRGSTVVAVQEVPSTFWDRPRLSAVDAAAPAGQASYRVRVTDGSGRSMTSQATVVDVPAGATPPAPVSALAQAVDADAPLHHWRLGESADGSLARVGLDRAGATDLALPASAVRGVAGATADGDAATIFAGGEATTSVPEQGLQSFSQEVWLRTTTTTGGKLVGFESSATGTSSGYDRHLWMGNDGRVSFGVTDGKLKVLRTPKALNDGAWHQVVATLNGGTAELFVDGAPVASLGGVRQAAPIDGYWRVGGGRLAGWPSAPTTTSFTGDLDDVALYRAPLSAQRVAAHHAAATTAAPAPPVVTPPVTPPPAPPAPPAPAPVEPPAGPAPAGTTLVADDFARTVASGLGAATTGGAWTTTPTSAFSVADGAGSVSVAPGRSAQARVGPAAAGADVRATVVMTKPAATDTALFSLVGRSVGTDGDYRVKVRSASNGTADLAVVTTTGGTERTVGRVFLARSVADPAGPLAVRLQVVPEGASTRLRASVWSGPDQPAGWQVDLLDATAVLQAPGTAGIAVYLSGSASPGRFVAAVDDLSVVAAG